MTCRAASNCCSGSAIRACSGARTSSSSATVKRGVICCEQFQSNASIVTTMRRSTFELVAVNDQHLRQIGLVIDVAGAHVAEHLQAQLMRIVHEEHRRAVIGVRVADGDVLAVARVVGRAERAIREMPYEAHGAATMLNKASRFR